MTITEYEYAAATVRALMAAETAMASVNCGAANVTRTQAEELLDNYFARVDRAHGCLCPPRWLDRTGRE